MQPLGEAAGLVEALRVGPGPVPHPHTRPVRGTPSILLIRLGQARGPALTLVCVPALLPSSLPCEHTCSAQQTEQGGRGLPSEHRWGGWGCAGAPPADSINKPGQPAPRRLTRLAERTQVCGLTLFTILL